MLADRSMTRRLFWLRYCCQTSRLPQVRATISTESYGNFGLGALFRLLGNIDAVHGVYYMMMWADVRLAGTGETATRLPSALAMAAAAAGPAAIGRRLVSPRAGLFAGLVFAALPQISWYGQDVRPYALVTALGTLASYLLVRVLGGAGPRRRWLAA